MFPIRPPQCTQETVATMLATIALWQPLLAGVNSSICSCDVSALRQVPDISPNNYRLGATSKCNREDTPSIKSLHHTLTLDTLLRSVPEEEHTKVKFWTIVLDILEHGKETPAGINCQVCSNISSKSPQSILYNFDQNIPSLVTEVESRILLVEVTRHWRSRNTLF